MMREHWLDAWNHPWGQELDLDPVSQAATSFYGKLQIGDSYRLFPGHQMGTGRTLVP